MSVSLQQIIGLGIDPDPIRILEEQPPAKAIQIVAARNGKRLQGSAPGLLRAFELAVDQQRTGNIIRVGVVGELREVIVVITDQETWNGKR